MQRQGRNSQETIVQPWGRVLVPPQGIHITTSLSCFADTETPSRWEKLTVCCPQSHRPQTGWTQKVDDADSQLPPHQPIRRVSTNWSYLPLWTIAITLLPIPSRWGHIFEGISPLWPPLPGKAMKLSFSTSPKTLSLRFNSVSGYRDWIWLQDGSRTKDQRPESNGVSGVRAFCTYESPRKDNFSWVNGLWLWYTHTHTCVCVCVCVCVKGGKRSGLGSNFLFPRNMGRS